MVSDYTISLLKKADDMSSDHLFIDWTTSRVIKVTKIENTLCYESMNELINLYCKLGINLDAYFRNDALITKFGFQEILQDGVSEDPFKYCREIISPEINKNSKYCKEIIDKYKLDEIKINTRDDKSRNFFVFDNKILLLDLADFFAVGYKNGEEINVLTGKSKYAKKYKLPKSAQNFRRINEHKYYFCY